MDRDERALRELAALLREHRPQPTGLQLDEIKRRVIRRRDQSTAAGPMPHYARTMRRLVAVSAAFLAIGGGTALAVKTAGGSKSTTTSAAGSQYNTGGQGCTPGYWKNQLGSWSGFSPGDSFNAVFGVNYMPGLTLEQALGLNGGGFAALARHATAALLNAEHLYVNYGLEANAIKALVQQAFATNNPEPIKNTFDTLNNAGCSIDAQNRPIG